MTFKNIILLVALLAFAAAARIEPSHSPHYHGHHHYKPVPGEVDPAIAPSNTPVEPIPVQEDIVEENDLGAPQNKDEVKDEDKNVPVNGLERLVTRKSIPAKCDALTLPKYSCFNCYSYLVCKPEGGKIKACKDPYAPYCNNGVCSQTPSDSCSNA